MFSCEFCEISKNTFFTEHLATASAFLKAIILKTFNDIVLAFLPVEIKANILYVNINFTGNLFYGFGRYSGKVVPEPATSHPF